MFNVCVIKIDDKSFYCQVLTLSILDWYSLFELFRRGCCCLKVGVLIIKMSGSVFGATISCPILEVFCLSLHRASSKVNYSTVHWQWVKRERGRKSVSKFPWRSILLGSIRGTIVWNTRETRNIYWLSQAIWYSRSNPEDQINKNPDDQINK